MENLLETYNDIQDCHYKNEHYSVRDNGAVLKHPRVDGRPRPTDNQWTFGKVNNANGYMFIASVRVHQIVATAFHGAPPTKQHVVDHIDTNRQNNRPENLRWVTKFENAMLNPITAKRIALVCGSVEAFLADPSKFRGKFPEKNISWMCGVSKQDAQISKERLIAWAENDKVPSGGSLGSWIFNRSSLHSKSFKSIPGFPDSIKSNTFNAVQRNWRIPSEFPCCPKKYVDEPMGGYSESIKKGSIFCRNDLYSSLVLKSALYEDGQLLYVLTESSEGKNAVKPWALAKVTFENGLFVHTNIQSFFELNGAEKQFCLVQGLEWNGGDSIDDYC